jgi:hypothetical protein
MDNKNIIISLMAVIIVFLAFLAFRPMLYGPISAPSSVYQSWPMGSGMGPGIGPGMMQGPGYNYSFAPRMMGYGNVIGSGNMMGYGDMMALYYPDAKPISSEKALLSMKELALQYGSNVNVEDFMTFSSNYYAVLKDTESSKGMAEVLVDRYSGLARPEPGPNMMWNTVFGAGRERSGGRSPAEAKKLAEDFLVDYLPGAKVMETVAMPGYYTFDFGRENIDGMLSVNAYDGEIWVHTWHGFYLGGHEGNMIP